MSSNTIEPEETRVQEQEEPPAVVACKPLRLLGALASPPRTLAGKPLRHEVVPYSRERERVRERHIEQGRGQAAPQSDMTARKQRGTFRNTMGKRDR